MKQRTLLITAILSAALFVNAGGGPAHPDGRGREVVMWTFQPYYVDEWAAREQEIEDRFNIDLILKLVPQNGFIQKLQAVILEGENAPDIIEWMFENNRILFSDPERSYVLPLNDLYKRSPVFQDVPDGRLSWVTYGGHIYGLPHDIYPVVLVYNDTLWKEVGVDVAALRDWDQFFTAALRLTEKKADGTPVHCALPSGDYGFGDSMWMIFQQSGIQLFDREGNPQLTSRDLKAFLTKWFRWRDNGVFGSWDWGNFGALLITGVYAAYTSPDWWVVMINAATEDGTYEWRVRDLPLYPGGNGCRTSAWGGSFLAVPRTVTDRDFIFKVIEYMQYGNPNIAVERYETSGMLAPIPAAWEDPVFHQPDPRFDGQSLGELQVRLAPESPGQNMADCYWDTIGDLNEQYTEIIQGNVSIDDALQLVQKKAVERLADTRRGFRPRNK